MNWVIKYTDGAYNLNHGFTATRDEATRYATYAEAKHVANDLFGVEAMEQITDAPLPPAAVAAIEECMGIIRMKQPRNGINSSENKLLERIIGEIESYFGVEEKNVNDVLLTRPAFRQYFIDD